MQGLVDQHGSKVVQGGALAGSPFRQLSEEQLRKAAKRYPSDPRLRFLLLPSALHGSMGWAWME